MAVSDEDKVLLLICIDGESATERMRDPLCDMYLGDRAKRMHWEEDIASTHFDRLIWLRNGLDDLDRAGWEDWVTKVCNRFKEKYIELADWEDDDRARRGTGKYREVVFVSSTLGLSQSVRHERQKVIEYTFIGDGLDAGWRRVDRSHELWGNHKRILAANEQAIAVAKLPVRVLLQGETGAGKSRLARFIHENSGRHYRGLDDERINALKGKILKQLLGSHKGKDVNDRFKELNLASLPASVLESELFGYVKGSHTGANDEGRLGLFLASNGGTLFLDEIAECPLEIQAKLLTVIQSRKSVDERGVAFPCYVKPLGQDEEVLVDVRLIVATNKDLRQEVAAGRFRRDLYYRLNEYEIKLPSMSQLEECRDEHIDRVLEEINIRFDTAGLVPSYVKKRLNDDARHYLRSYEFPGNYRQLENCLLQACVSSYYRYTRPCKGNDGRLVVKDRDEITPSELPDEVRDYEMPAEIPTGMPDVAKRCVIEAVQRRLCRWEDIRKIEALPRFRWVEENEPMDVRGLLLLVDAMRWHGNMWKREKYSAEIYGGKTGDPQRMENALKKFGLTFTQLYQAITGKCWSDSGR